MDDHQIQLNQLLDYQDKQFYLKIKQAILYYMKAQFGIIFLGIIHSISTLESQTYSIISFVICLGVGLMMIIHLIHETYEINKKMIKLNKVKRELRARGEENNEEKIKKFEEKI